MGDRPDRIVAALAAALAKHDRIGRHRVIAKQDDENRPIRQHRPPGVGSSIL